MDMWFAGSSLGLRVSGQWPSLLCIVLPSGVVAWANRAIGPGVPRNSNIGDARRPDRFAGAPRHGTSGNLATLAV